MGYDTVQWAKPLEGIRIILIVKVVGSVCVGGGKEKRRRGGVYRRVGEPRSPIGDEQLRIALRPVRNVIGACLQIGRE